MPGFFDPYGDEMVRGKFMNRGELADAVRRDIQGELEAIEQYDSHIRATSDQVAIGVWTDIRNEERIHVGQLFALLAYIDPEEAKYFSEGEKEAQEMMREMGVKPAPNL